MSGFVAEIQLSASLEIITRVTERNMQFWCNNLEISAEIWCKHINFNLLGIVLKLSKQLGKQWCNTIKVLVQVKFCKNYKFLYFGIIIV